MTDMLRTFVGLSASGVRTPFGPADSTKGHVSGWRLTHQGTDLINSEAIRIIVSIVSTAAISLLTPGGVTQLSITVKAQETRRYDVTEKTNRVILT